MSATRIIGTKAGVLVAEEVAIETREENGILDLEADDFGYGWQSSYENLPMTLPSEALYA